MRASFRTKCPFGNCFTVSTKQDKTRADTAPLIKNTGWEGYNNQNVRCRCMKLPKNKLEKKLKNNNNNKTRKTIPKTAQTIYVFPAGGTGNT